MEDIKIGLKETPCEVEIKKRMFFLNIIIYSE